MGYLLSDAADPVGRDATAERFASRRCAGLGAVRTTLRAARGWLRCMDGAAWQADAGREASGVSSVSDAQVTRASRDRGLRAGRSTCRAGVAPVRGAVARAMGCAGAAWRPVDQHGLERPDSRRREERGMAAIKQEVRIGGGLRHARMPGTELSIP